LQALPVIPVKFRKLLLRLAGLRIGREVTIFSESFFGSGKCEIGSGSFISIRCLIDGSDWVRIGSRVYLAPGVEIITGTHVIGPPECRAGPHANQPVEIGDGCWLGASSIVLPGVRVAKGCIIGAGAVVVSSTEPNGVYAGVSARRIRDLPAGYLPAG